MAIQIKLRRDQSSIWDSDNPVLLAGEMAFQFDSGTSQVGRFKIGNGSREWSRLPYFYAYQDSSGAYPSSGGGGGASWYGARGLFIGGYRSSQSSVIDYFAIASAGNATSGATLSVAKYDLGSASNGTTAINVGGHDGSNAANSMDYFTISDASTAAADFGDLTGANQHISAFSDGTYGVFGTGYAGGFANVIEYVTIATPGNSTDFGDATHGRQGTGSANDATYGLFSGGQSGSGYLNIIDYVTIATPGNATDFGDLTLEGKNGAGTSDTTRSVFLGRRPSSGANNVIDYVTTATPGNATDFGDLTVTQRYNDACSDATYAVTGGGIPGSGTQGHMDYITIQTTGNATSFGELSSAGYGCSSCSGAAA